MHQFTVTQPRDTIVRHSLGNGHTLIANYRLGLVEVTADDCSYDYITLLDRSNEPHDHIRDGWVTERFLEAKGERICGVPY